MLLDREEGRERNIDGREKHGSVTSHTHEDLGLHTHRLGIEPTNQESNSQPFNYKMMLQLSHTSQSYKYLLITHMLMNELKCIY